MAWNGRFGDEEEGRGLELSLGLPGYFSKSPTHAAGSVSCPFPSCSYHSVVLCYVWIERVSHGFNDRCVLCRFQLWRRGALALLPPLLLEQREAIASRRGNR